MARLLILLLLVAPTVAVGQEAVAVRPEIAFLAAQDGASKIAGGTDDEFFAKLQLREVAAMTGVTAGDKSVQESRIFARDFFRSAVLDFTAAERDALRVHLDRMTEAFGEKYPVLIRRPWKFLKTRKDLCGGFSFTRGDCIVLSESTLSRFVKAANSDPLEAKQGESLLLHEQMHVLQRARPELFKPLYESVFHFKSGKVSVHPWIDERQVTNPDGVSDDWVAVTSGENGNAKLHWFGTLLLDDKPVHTMGRDFSSVAVPLTKHGTSYRMVVGADGIPIFRSLDDLSEFTSRLPIRGGYDHPNEVAAYLFTVITHGPSTTKLNGQAADVMEQAKAWFATNLKPNG